jgi:hypothetical protein
MDIRAVTQEKTVVLRDVDVNLVGGDTYPLTAQPDDELTIAVDGRIELRVAKTGERIVILAQHVRWFSIRERAVIVKESKEA